MRKKLHALLVATMILAEVARAAAQAPPPLALPPLAPEEVSETPSQNEEDPSRAGSEPSLKELGRAQVVFFAAERWPTLAPEKAKPFDETQGLWLYFTPLTHVADKTKLFLNVPMNRADTELTAAQSK